MKITPNTLTLQQLFLVANEQFSIPAYQRRYAWGTKQHRELFDDIRLLPDGDTHLFGTVLFLTETHSPGLNVLELVDGQQRITTLCLLLKVLANRFRALNDEESEQEIHKLLRCKGLDKQSQPKLLLGDLDHPDYIKLTNEENPADVTNRQLVEAHSNFAEWVGQLEEDELARFYFKLLNSATVIRLDVGQAKDAYKLFETINNRGLRLRPTDIIKNFLLGHASSLGEATLKKVKDDWRRLIVALDHLDSDDFFRQHLAGQLHRKISASKLVSEFKAHYLRIVLEAETLTEYRTFSMAAEMEESEPAEENEDEFGEEEVVESVSKSEAGSNKIKLTDFSSRLRQAAETYGQMRKRQFDSQVINRHLRNLERIKSFPAYTFLLELFQRNFPESICIHVLRMIESFMMRRHICLMRTGELDSIFASLAGIPSENFENHVRDGLKAHIPSDDEFEEAFTRFPFVSKSIDRARYSLEMFEYQLIGHREEYYLADPDQLHLEHVIPLTIETKKAKTELGDWPTYLGVGWKKKHATHVHRIGNMTLLADELNISASNNPYLAKKKKYKESNIQLTKDLCKLGVFKFNTVEARSKALAKIAVRIWSI